MTWKALALAALILVATLPSAAAHAGEHGGSEADTGWFLPDSPLYPVEIIWDTAALALGMTSPQEVAEKRAAEVKVMIEKGDFKAAKKAAKNMMDAAEKTDEEDIKKIETAVHELSDVINKTPDNDQGDLQKIYENVKDLVTSSIS